MRGWRACATVAPDRYLDHGPSRAGRAMVDILTFSHRRGRRGRPADSAHLLACWPTSAFEPDQGPFRDRRLCPSWVSSGRQSCLLTMASPANDPSLVRGGIPDRSSARYEVEDCLGDASSNQLMTSLGCIHKNKDAR